MPVSTSLLANPAAREATMLEPLTDLERGILEYLIEYLRANTYQPSIREIGHRFAIKSTKTVSEHLQSLADKGWIERDPARSRGIRVLGLELDLNTVLIPVFEMPTGEAAGDILTAVPGSTEPVRQLRLDRSLVGSTRASFLAMPDNSLADVGINEGDLLLIEPIAPEDLDSGDFLVTYPDGEPRVQYLDGQKIESAKEAGQSAPAQSYPLGSAIGRVSAIFRRLRGPADLVAARGAADADAHTHTS
jgi:repressor LexA